MTQLNVDKLSTEFSNPQKPVASADILSTELQKLQNMRSTRDELLKRFNPNQVSTQQSFEKEDPGLIKRILYYFFLLGGFIQQSSASFIYCFSLLALIPGLLNIWIIIISIVYTILDCVLFYAFQADLLKSAMGLDFNSPDSLKLLETYEEQRKLTIEINELLSKLTVITSGMTLNEYNNFIALAKLYNADLESKEERFREYPESCLRKSFKYGMYGFGIISTVAANYFTANALLVAIGGGLAGSPLGWAIIVLLTISSLAFFYAMEGKSLYLLANPDFTLFKELQSNLGLFKKSKFSNSLDSSKEIVNTWYTRKDHLDTPDKCIEINSI